MYQSYLSECRDMILHFYHKYFPDPDCLRHPDQPSASGVGIVRYRTYVLRRETSARDYKILNKAIRDHGLSIPPLVNSYMNLSPTMRCFSTAVNTEFGDVEETGILVTIDDIFDTKTTLIDTYRELIPIATDLQDGFQSNRRMLLTESRRLSTSYGLLTLQAPAPLPPVEPGQFVRVRVDSSKSTFLRRPISINDADSEKARSACWSVRPEKAPKHCLPPSPDRPSTRYFRSDEDSPCRHGRSGIHTAHRRWRGRGAPAPPSAADVKPASIRNFCLGALRIRPVAA